MGGKDCPDVKHWQNYKSCLLCNFICGKEFGLLFCKISQIVGDLNFYYATLSPIFALARAIPELQQYRFWPTIHRLTLFALVSLDPKASPGPWGLAWSHVVLQPFYLASTLQTSLKNLRLQQDSKEIKLRQDSDSQCCGQAVSETRNSPPLPECWRDWLSRSSQLYLS